MPLADRDPLRAAEARVCELEGKLAAAKRECGVDGRKGPQVLGVADAPAQAEQHAVVGHFFGQVRRRRADQVARH
eukprot:1339562-Prymnesium_polylepis.1